MALSIGVTLTWIVFTILFVLSGLWSTVLFRGTNQLTRIRIALWFGFAQVIALLILINFFTPLGRATPMWILWVVAGVSLIVWLLRRGWRLSGNTTPSAVGRHNWWVAIPIALLGLAVLLAAHSFASPLTNYDAGLYHLNAIQYSAEYPTIPGLANLHSRLGTNTTPTLLSAVMTITPWGIEVFRLLVGLFIFMFVVDLVLRLLAVRRTPNSPGTILMLLAALGFMPYLINEPGMSVTSPTPDTISMILVVVATAYLLDAFWKRNILLSGVAAIIAVLAATVRTQLWVFAGLLVVVLIVHALRSPSRSTQWRKHRIFIVISAALILLLGISMMIRDYILSGWLLFPAAFFPMPVDWRVTDPVGAREWILSWAREPGGSPDTVLNSWTWLWPWVGRTATDWAIQLAFGALIASALVWALVSLIRKGQSNTLRPRIGVKGLVLLAIPAVASMVVWFFTAPDPRFAWGTLVVIGLIPLSLGLTQLAEVVTKPDQRVLVTAVVSAFMALIIAGPAVSQALQVRGYVAEGYELRSYSFGPFEIVAHINPVETAIINEYPLDDGNTILSPFPEDRCHLTFPACRPYPDATMQFRGDSVADGFRDGS